MEWINDEMKEQARRADLIGFLQEIHPGLIVEKKPGEYAYAERTCITFFKGRDGVYRYCDHKKRQQGDWDHSGDGIDFLRKFVGDYDFEDAVLALAQYDEYVADRAQT